MAKQTQVPQPEQANVEGSVAGLKISSLLKKARESSGKSIEDISRITKINPNYIGYIENGETDKLPSNIFLKGYIYSIAKVLGIERDEVRENFDLSTTKSPLISNRTKGMDSEILLPTIGKTDRKSILPTIFFAFFSIGALLLLSTFLLDDPEGLEESLTEEIKVATETKKLEEASPDKEFTLEPKAVSKTDGSTETTKIAEPKKTTARQAPTGILGENSLEISLKDGPVEIAYRIDRKGEFKVETLYDPKITFYFNQTFEVYCANHESLSWKHNQIEITELERGFDNRFVFKSAEAAQE